AAYYAKLKVGAGRSEALRQAQLQMLGNRDTSHPHLWASFIVSGDWRTLDEAPVAPDSQSGGGNRADTARGVGVGAVPAALTGAGVVIGRRRVRLRVRGEHDS